MWTAPNRSITSLNKDSIADGIVTSQEMAVTELPVSVLIFLAASSKGPNVRAQITTLAHSLAISQAAA